jgi:hypothetical protein
LAAANDEAKASVVRTTLKRRSKLMGKTPGRRATARRWIIG